jgi:PAS domain S-box-containing protein
MIMPTPSESDPAQRGLFPAAPAQISPRHHLLWFALSIILVSGLLISLTLSYLRDQAIESGKQLTESFVQVIEEQTTRTIQTIDQRLQLAANGLAQLSASGGPTEQSARVLLSEHLKDLPFARALWVMDSQGRIIYEAGSGNIGLNLADRAYFQIYIAQPQTGFYMGTPVKGRTTNRWVISAARPLKAADGSFNGIIVAAVEPPYFDKLWSTVNLGEGGSIALFRRDGTLMMRSPFDEASMGKRFSSGPIFKDLLPVKPSGSVQYASAIDGKFRVFAYSTLPEFPDFVALIGKSFDVILAPWRQFAALALGIWMMASATVITLCLFLDRAWQQRLSTEARAQQMAQRLTLATDAAAIGVWDWDMNQADQWFATPTYFTMLGYNPDEGFANREQWVERLHPEDKQLVTQRIQAILEGQDMPYEYEARLRHADGSYHWISVVGRVLTRDDNGRASRLMGVRTDITARKRVEAELRESASQLRALSRRVLEAQETERRRVAIELHDELGQSLTAIKINLQANARFKDHSPEELNTENIRIVEHALQQVRHLALALRPSMLDDLGLVPALRWMAQQTAERSGFTTHFVATELQSRLSPEIETACFRVVQEALTNIARHGQAKEVEIALHLDGNALVLSVTDDGCGFDLAAIQARALAGGSIGVLGMQERAMLIGGHLDIESTPGHGSTVRLRCPLRRRGELA